MDRKLAARLARYAALAYESPAAVRAALPQARVTFIDRDHTQAYVIEVADLPARSKDSALRAKALRAAGRSAEAGHTAVAFRGTQITFGFSLADVASNLWVRRVPWDPGKVHRGYREAVLDIAQELKHPLYSAKRPLYFTGHSMGGALATLASTFPPGPSATYTFGAPRVGDRAFAKALRNVVRIVHGQDIAPKYPLFLGYRHGGKVWHLKADGSLDPGLPPWWPLLVPFTRKGLTKGILDHRVGEYAGKLSRLAV